MSANLIGLVSTLIVNYLSNSLPLNGKTPADISDSFPNLFVPSGSTFAIWGVIYTWLLVFAGVQIGAFFNASLMRRIEPIIERIGWLFVATCVLNISWLFAWHWGQLLLSVGIMSTLMVTLVRLNLMSGVGQNAQNSLEKWVIQAPFNIYQGWISIALIANVTALLVGHGWYAGATSDESIPIYSTVAMIVVGSIVAVSVVLRGNHVFHGLAVSWALYGIHQKREMYVGDAPSAMIGTVALVCLGVVLVAVALRVKNWLAY